MRLIATFSLLAGITVLGIGCEGQSPDSDVRPPVRQKIETDPNHARPESPAINNELNQPMSKENQQDPVRRPEKAAPLNPPSQAPRESKPDFTSPELPDKSAIPENKTE